MTRKTAGKVILVGAGPGDPGLLTVRGAEALREADVVLYDRLINPEILAIARAETTLIFVGKPAHPQDVRLASGHIQAEIHRLLIEHARAGKVVVRLKGGDPFVFGRGGEEIQALVEAGVAYELVSGVSSAIAVPAAARIPVTHRQLANSFAVFAGQEAAGDAIPWAAAAAMPTAIFLMGVQRLPEIVKQLIVHGRDPLTPVAIISQGTLPEQVEVTGTLADIVGLSGHVAAPAVIVVGQVVELRDSLTSRESAGNVP